MKHRWHLDAVGHKGKLRLIIKRFEFLKRLIRLIIITLRHRQDGNARMENDQCPNPAC